jgi:hypothetical protein
MLNWIDRFLALIGVVGVDRSLLFKSIAKTRIDRYYDSIVIAGVV